MPTKPVLDLNVAERLILRTIDVEEADMDLRETYGIGEVSKIAGVSTRTLRFYEEEGLLKPTRGPNGYRRYTPADIDRLQEILLLRHMGVGTAEIPRALSATEDERRRALAHHLETLKTEHARLEALIRTVETTIAHIEKGTPMSDKAKFEGMKRGLIEDNEHEYGKEVRERWGDAAADEANRKMLNLSEGEFERFQELGRAINEALEAAVTAGADPTGQEGERICSMHREWLGFTWNFYTPEAHRGLAEMYVADERFTAYYDGNVAGCATWLHGAITAHAR